MTRAIWPRIFGGLSISMLIFAAFLRRTSALSNTLGVASSLQTSYLSDELRAPTQTMTDSDDTQPQERSLQKLYPCPWYDNKVFSDYKSTQNEVHCNVLYTGQHLPTPSNLAGLSVPDCMAQCDAQSGCHAFSVILGGCMLDNNPGPAIIADGSVAGQKVSWKLPEELSTSICISNYQMPPSAFPASTVTAVVSGVWHTYAEGHTRTSWTTIGATAAS